MARRYRLRTATVLASMEELKIEKAAVSILYRDHAFEAFEDFSHLVDLGSCET
jgi:hypothetical protein